MNRIAAGCVAILCYTGCEPGQPTRPSSENFPSLALAIGSEVREVPFATVQCTDQGAERRIELLAVDQVADAQGTLYTPHVLVAQLKGTEVPEAHAFAATTSFAGHDYPLIQAVAKKLPDHPAPNCRAEVVDGMTTITCNETIVVPWLAPGPRPKPSFKVTFHCP